MRKHCFIRFILFLIVIVSLNCIAQATQSPVNLMQRVANRLITKLAQNKAILKSSRADRFIHTQVNAIIVPIVNVNYMAQAVIGRYYWGQATSAQRSAFIRQFKKLVIANYSAALASYDDDVVDVYPLRTNTWKKQGVATVQSVIKRKSGQRISITYFMSNDTGRWLINDFTIENISIIENYRAQFASSLSQGGLGHLVQQLTAHNKAIRS